jgi:hypothetical protein
MDYFNPPEVLGAIFVFWVMLDQFIWFVGVRLTTDSED